MDKQRIFIKLTLFILVFGFVGFYWVNVGEVAYFGNYYNNLISNYNNCLYRSPLCNLSIEELPTNNITILRELSREDAKNKKTYYDTERFIFKSLFYLTLIFWVWFLFSLIKTKELKETLIKIFYIDFKNLYKILKKEIDFNDSNRRT